MITRLFLDFYMKGERGKGEERVVGFEEMSKKRS